MLSEPTHRGPSTRTPHEIDAALEEWKRRLAAIANNLLELQAQPAYKMLTAPDSAVTGITAAQVQPALAAVPRMFEHFGMVHATIERAAALRASTLAFFASESRLREAEYLLFGRSIHLADADIPLDQRSLLTAGRTSEDVSAEMLLTTMTATFAAARDAVLAVDRAWTTLAPALTAAESRLAALQAATSNESALTEVTNFLATLTARLQSDPFGVSHDLHDRLEPLLTRLEHQVQRAARLQRDLTQASALLDDLRRAERETASAQAEAQSKILTATAATPSAVPGLEQWLARLTATHSTGNPEALEVGLRHWHAALSTCLKQERQRTATQRALLDTRDELCGRLEALKAKARRRHLDQTGPVTARAQEADRLLRARPTDLARAAAAVAAFEHLLTGAALAPEAQPQ